MQYILDIELLLVLDKDGNIMEQDVFVNNPKDKKSTLDVYRKRYCSDAGEYKIYQLKF